jgi:hypothetical protein
MTADEVCYLVMIFAAAIVPAAAAYAMAAWKDCRWFHC